MRVFLDEKLSLLSKNAKITASLLLKKDAQKILKTM